MSNSVALIIFGGLPGTGKTTLSRMLAERRGALYLRIDTIEQALRNSQALNGSSWHEVAAREYQQWDRAHFVVDTGGHRVRTRTGDQVCDGE
jgi:predicted kinase